MARLQEHQALDAMTAGDGWSRYGWSRYGCEMCVCVCVCFSMSDHVVFFFADVQWLMVGG